MQVVAFAAAESASRAAAKAEAAAAEKAGESDADDELRRLQRRKAAHGRSAARGLCDGLQCMACCGLLRQSSRSTCQPVDRPFERSF